MALRAAAVACLLVPALWTSPARAWTPKTRVRMVEDATRLLPETLSVAVKRYREQLLRGMLEPMEQEGGAAHRPPWSGGQLDAEVESAARDLRALLEKPAPFPEIVRRFGVLAHYVSDAGFPPGASESGGAAHYAHFASFCESRRERFPLVFGGHADEALGRNGWRPFALRMLHTASGDDEHLARAYAAAGDPPNPAAFDDRSIPFSVGSLAYSRTVTNIVRAWLTVWSEAGGDMARTPYRQPKAAAPR